MNIVITNLKGGVGKTTTAVYLAAAAAEKGHEVMLIDADRQASSAVWLEERPLDGVEVVEAPSERTLVRAMGKHEAWGSSTRLLGTSASCRPRSQRPTRSSSRPGPAASSIRASR